MENVLKFLCTYIGRSFLLRPRPVCALPDKRYRKIILIYTGSQTTGVDFDRFQFDQMIHATPRVVSGSHEIPPLERALRFEFQILVYGLMSSSNRLGKLEGPQTMS